MFKFFNKESKGTIAKFKITGMHCTSCSMNIDGTLEDTEGVISATTSYAKAETVVEYDPSKVTTDELKLIIESLDYTVQLL